MELPFYHGNISKKTGEELLYRKGLNGSFLLRDSESVPDTFCLCVLFQRFIYTYRIFKIGSKFKIETAEGVQEKIFSTLRDLIVHFEKPNKGLIIPLIYPVQYQRTTCTKRKITIFPEGTYSEIKDEDYVVVLP
ncbi:SH2 domain-containing protein 1A-like isoform X1 [Lissotriton helveticus]